MPKAFMACVAQGGRVRTVHPRPGLNMPVCFSKSGHSYAGEAKRAHQKLTKAIKKKGR